MHHTCKDYTLEIAKETILLGYKDFNNTREYNREILTLSKIMINVISSAAELEVGALFHNAKAGKPIIVTLDEMGNPQQATPIHKDNPTDDGIVNDTIQQNITNAMNMQFY